MGITCTNLHSIEENSVKGSEDEELDILTPRPEVKKDVVFIWNLDIFTTLMTSCSENKEKEIFQKQVEELVLDLAEWHLYYKDLKDYEIANIYDNPLTDTGQNLEEMLDDNMTIKEKQKYNRVTSMRRKVKESYCQKCKENINELISGPRENQWSNVRQNINELKDKWLSDAIKSLQIINSRVSCVNILLTTSHLLQAISHVLLLGLGDMFRIENIYSTANIGKEKSYQRIARQFGTDCNVFVFVNYLGKEKSYQRIARQFGTDCNVFVFGVSSYDEKIAEKLKMAFWKVADQSDVDSLHHALTLNYL